MQPTSADPELRPTALMTAFFDKYARRYVFVYAVGLAFLLATNWLAVTIPDLIKDVFDALSAGTDASRIHQVCGLIAAAAVAVIVVRTLSRVLFFNPGRTIEFRLRNDMLQRLLSMSQTWLRGEQTGDLVSRAINDATFVRALVGFAVLQLLNVVMAAGLALWKMSLTDGWLTLYCAIPLAISGVVLRYGTRRLFDSFRETQQELGKVSEHILETYNGIFAIASMAAQEAFLVRFDERNDRYTRLNLKVTALRVFLLPLASSMGNICIFLLLLVGGQRAMDGHLTIGDMAAYASYAAILVNALAMSGWLLNSIQRGFVSLQRCWQVIKQQSDRPVGNDQIQTDGVGLHVSVRGLSYRYPDAAQGEPETLAGVSFEIPPGSTLGVYGAVGSGKTTLLQLVAGLLTPPSHTVFVDGLDVRTVAWQPLRAAVAVVPQTSFLFSRALRENVGFVDSGREIDDERVRAAVERACLSDEVERLSDGINTVVGERGLTLSGGQRQRAQLARAFYRNYRLLLLDDVLSAVDHETEERLLESIAGELKAHAQRPSAIIVSSRISALAAANEIIVLEHGRVAERGSHTELVARGGLYAEAHAAQLDTETVAVEAAAFA
jgi:ATP-binding cassette, subfamily B, multidrug efflux pump